MKMRVNNDADIRGLVSDELPQRSMECKRRKAAGFAAEYYDERQISCCPWLAQQWYSVLADDNETLPGAPWKPASLLGTRG